MNLKLSNIINLLKEVEIFSGFDDKTLGEFAKLMQEVKLAKDDILFSKGDNEHAMYIVVEGSVQIHDNEYIFTTLNRKQFFGEYSLIDSAFRSATVTAVRDTELLELEQSDFNKVTNSNPMLWHNVLIALIKRLRDYNIIEEKLTMRTLDIQKKSYALEMEKDSIKDQKKELESINSTKDKFFTIIANDLKAPFTSIHQVANTLETSFEQLDETLIMNYLSQINKFSKNAQNLLDRLLQWAQSQTGSLTINFKRTNLYRIVNEVTELFDASLQNKQLTLKVNVNENIHGYFDVDMITLVFRNIISNAITFSKDGGNIIVDASENNDMINIIIKDEGIGMEPSVLDALFKIDKRNNLNTAEDSEHVGLGLILSKEFVLKNGGEIWAESIKHKGTTIKFTLPKAL